MATIQMVFCWPNRFSRSAQQQSLVFVTIRVYLLSFGLILSRTAAELFGCHLSKVTHIYTQTEDWRTFLSFSVPFQDPTQKPADSPLLNFLWSLHARNIIVWDYLFIFSFIPSDSPPSSDPLNILALKECQTFTTPKPQKAPQFYGQHGCHGNDRLQWN